MVDKANHREGLIVERVSDTVVSVLFMDGSVASIPIHALELAKVPFMNGSHRGAYAMADFALRFCQDNIFLEKLPLGYKDSGRWSWTCCQAIALNVECSKSEKAQAVCVLL